MTFEQTRINGAQGENYLKALVKQQSEPGLSLKDVPDPELGINDVLIKTDRAGIVSDRRG